MKEALLNQLFYILGSFANLPNWLRNTIYILGGLGIVGIGIGFSPTVAVIAGIGILFAVVVLGIYFYVLKRRQDARTAALGGELQQNSQVTPSAISDPARKARLEDLRKRFQQGLDKFKAVGKDLYKLPWYVVIGEPAAGKSEAIRHSDVGFPPGMQDDFQGVGGTINMNWWFTNYAVILDTAGRLLFEEVAPGTTSEWKEFLALLRKHRPNCPINGLLLVIPADSLVKDSEKRIEERAGVIARKLENIQRELDIRFPVYVVIAKCDLLNGFREFFEEVDDPAAKRQMLGWSNPDSIDTSFALEKMEEHLRTVVERLRRRRLKLLEDPVAKSSDRRRTDEVDRLYAFPNSIALITPSLRRYLSTIFIESEWSTRPLFLRGIYFTSSLREGSELDQELAQAIGVSVDELPSGRVWERETSLFLRDLFTEKIFREWGLVTRATNTLRMLRRRKLAIFGFGGLALAVFLLLSLLGYRAMRDSIGNQSGYWLRASEGWSPQSEWMPLVTSNESGFRYNGQEPIGRGTGSKTRDLFNGAGKSLVEFHAALRDFTGSQLRIATIFRPFYRLTGNVGEEKRRAQRIVFEGSVVKPIVESARSRISSAAPGSDPNLEASALLALIRIESGIAKRRQNLNEKIAPVDKVLAPLLAYTTGAILDPRLAELSTWTYSKGDGTQKWPAGWLSGGETLAGDRPGYNRAIDLGLERFRKSALQSLAESENQWRLISEIANLLKNDYALRERSLFQAVANQGGIQQRDPLLETPYKALGNANKALADKLQEAKAADLFRDPPVSLSAAYEQILKERSNQQGLLKSMLDELLGEAVSAETEGSPSTLLLKEIQDRLSVILKEIQVELKGLDLAELKALDKAYLGDYAGRGPVADYRFNLYSLSFEATRAKPQFDRLIGTDWAGLKKVIEDAAKVRNEVGVYDGEFKKECQSVCDYWLAYAERHQINEFCSAYLTQAREAIAPLLGFPLVWPPEERALTTDELRGAGQLLTTIHKDLRSETFKKIPSEARAPLEAFDKQLSQLDPVVRGLIAPNGNLAVCSISMSGKLSAGAQQRMQDVRYELRAGTPVSGDHLNLGKQGRVPLGEARLLIDRLPVDETFHFHRYDPAKHEVPSGPNWCALRLLIKTKETSAFAQDGINWEVRIDDSHPEVTANLVFEYALPKLPNWPTRQSVLPTSPR